MKKLLIVLVIIAGVVFGGLKFNANKVEEKYNEALNLIKANGMEVKNSVFEGGLLKSHANYDVVLSKNYINELVSLGEEYGAPEDLAIKIDMNISHGFDSLLGKFEVAGDAEFLNDPYKNFIKEIFDTTRPIKFHADGASGGDKKFVFELVGVQKEQDGNKLNLAKSFLNFDINGEKKITGATFVNDFIDFASKQGVAIKIKNIDYDVKYETPIEPNMISKALVNSAYKFELGGIDVISGAEALQIGKIASDSKLTVLSDTLTQDDTSTIEKIKYGKYEFKDFLIKTKFSNLDKGAFEDIINAKGEPEAQLAAIMQALDKSIKRAPKLTFENLNFKNAAGKSYVSNFEISIDPDGIDSQNFLDNIPTAINFSGKIELDTTPGEFIFGSGEEKEGIDAMLVNGGLFKENGGKYVTIFKYNKRTQDLIFNENLSLKSLFQ
ncbi:DUF945 family protein [uncultured Campylobacter sp.]|uniref:DUF945 family protein n=1 Tax=uncultured Campylobacter sp. TaxID=218934 RepID=UPI0026147D50|nr:DUF945 family protein [uncultured Campylobacter sp.]